MKAGTMWGWGAALAAGALGADAATVSGTVKFSGTAPKAKIIRMTEAHCQKEYPKGRASEELTVGKGGALKYVFVHVASGLEAKAASKPQGAVLLDQKTCWYEPHIIALQVGQDMKVRNSDTFLHNVNLQAKLNPRMNIGQPKQGMEKILKFDKPEIGIPVKCDVHGWMKAYICVVPHGFFAVTDDEGRFEIKDLPAGTYEIEAWHEKLGTSRQKITVAAADKKAVDFAFSGK